MKKILALILVVALMAVMFVGCAGGNGDTETADPTTGNNTDTSADTDTGNDASESNDPVVSGSDVKVGVVLVGDENEGYTYAHILGIQEAVANLGLNEADNIVWKYTVKEDEAGDDAIVDCSDQGCALVFTNS